MELNDIWLSIFQNLDKLLADLEQVEVTIAGAKSQFYQVSIKIIGYICNIDGCHLNILKVLKILDWSECINTTSSCIFMGICIYYYI